MKMFKIELERNEMFEEIVQMSLDEGKTVKDVITHLLEAALYADPQTETVDPTFVEPQTAHDIHQEQNNWE
tara:strand:+ start:1083 stop:1295 length:213 start_codon:yes stop_codon:yes gene_type:complete